MRVEFGFAAGLKNDLERPLLPFRECGARDLDRLAVCRGVLHLELATAADLKPVLKIGAGGQGVGAEAGAGIVHFEKLDGRAGAIFDGGVDVVGVAGGKEESGERQSPRRAQNAIRRGGSFAGLLVGRRSFRCGELFCHGFFHAVEALEQLRQALKDGDGAKPDAVVEAG